MQKLKIIIVFLSLGSLGFFQALRADEIVTSSKTNEVGHFRLQFDIEIDAQVYKGLPAFANLRLKNISTPPWDPNMHWRTRLQLPQEEREKLSQYKSLTYNVAPHFDLLSTAPPVTLNLINERQEQIDVSYKSWARGAIMTEWGLKPTVGSIGLNAGEIQNHLLDLGPWINQLPKGKYELSLQLKHSDRIVFLSNPVTIHVQELSDEVKKVLQQAGLADVYKEKGSPNIYIDTNSVAFLKADTDYALLEAGLSKEAFEQLAVHTFLQQCLGRRELNNVSLDTLNRMLHLAPHHLQPTLETFLYQVLQAQNQKEQAEVLKARLLAEHPEVAWRLSLSSNGEGYLSILKMLWEATSRHVRPNPMTNSVTKPEG